jgi:hypothetical protein
LGLPTRIRDEDCDIEMLEPSDFEEEDHAAYPKFLGLSKREHVLFAIEMAKLAVYRPSPCDIPSYNMLTFLQLAK